MKNKKKIYLNFFIKTNTKKYKEINLFKFYHLTNFNNKFYVVETYL